MDQATVIAEGMASLSLQHLKSNFKAIYEKINIIAWDDEDPSKD